MTEAERKALLKRREEALSHLVTIVTTYPLDHHAAAQMMAAIEMLTGAIEGKLDHLRKPGHPA